MTQSPAVSTRSNYWDSWKGYAIVSVVAIHSLGEAIGFPIDDPNFAFGIIFRQFINFAVPMFFALAGYFANFSPDTPTCTFYRKKLARIIPPYIFWTLLTLGLKAPKDLTSPSLLALDIFLGRGIGIGYFIIALVQFVLLTPLLSRIKGGRGHFAIMLGLMACGLSISYFVRISLPNSEFSQFPNCAIPFFVWYPFYHLGFFISSRKELLVKSAFGKPRLAIFLYMVFSVLACGEAALILRTGAITFAVSQIKITCYLASISLFLFAVSAESSLDGRRAMPLATNLGRKSFTIYLSHMIFLPKIALTLRGIGFIHDIQPIYVLICCLTTIIATVAMINVGNRILPPRLNRLVLP